VANFTETAEKYHREIALSAYVGELKLEETNDPRRGRKQEISINTDKSI
jgi:hypothetical protein